MKTNTTHTTEEVLELDVIPEDRLESSHCNSEASKDPLGRNQAQIKIEDQNMKLASYFLGEDVENLNQSRNGDSESGNILKDRLDGVDKMEEDDEGFDNNLDAAVDDQFGFREEDYEELLDSLSLLDRERYAELLRQRHKIEKMKEELRAKWNYDDGLNVNHSQRGAWKVNRRFNTIVSKVEVDEARQKVLDRRYAGKASIEEDQIDSYAKADENSL